MSVKNEISKFDILKLFITGMIYKTFQVIGRRKCVYVMALLIFLISNLIFNDLIIKLFIDVALVIIILSEKRLNEALTVNRFTGELHMSFEKIKELKNERNPYEKLNILINKFNDGVLKLADSKDPFITCKKQFYTNTNEVIYKAFYKRYGCRLRAEIKKCSNGEPVKKNINEKFLLCNFKDLFNFSPDNYKKFSRKVKRYKIVFNKCEIESICNAVN